MFEVVCLFFGLVNQRLQIPHIWLSTPAPARYRHLISKRKLHVLIQRPHATTLAPQLLSRGRLLFIAAHAARFSDRIAAENDKLRDEVDAEVSQAIDAARADPEPVFADAFADVYASAGRH